MGTLVENGQTQAIDDDDNNTERSSGAHRRQTATTAGARFILISEVSEGLIAIKGVFDDASVPFAWLRRRGAMR